MAEGMVGKVKNKNFAFFWLLIGGSVGNIIMILYNLSLWPIFLPPVVLSILIAIKIADKIQRPKILLGVDLLLTILLILLAPFFGAYIVELAILVPDALIIFGCILAIMNW